MKSLTKIIIFNLALLILITCNSNDRAISNSNDETFSNSNEKVYVTAQGLDQVNIINVINNTVSDEQEIIPFNYNENLPDNPHFIDIDVQNGVWFTTLINSGFVAMLDLETNILLDSIEVGDSPALMAHNANNKKLYVSRMMPMGGMMPAAVSNMIQILSYESDTLFSEDIYDLHSPAPHGITISGDGIHIYVTSNTTDWLYKVNTVTGETTSTSLNSAGNSEEFEINFLKPIQVRILNDLIVISCSAGKWYNSSTGENTEIPGSVKLLTSQDLSLVAEYEFDWYSKPWHITVDEESNEIFVALAGDLGVANSAGAANLIFENNSLSLNWISTNSIYQTLHGIELSSNQDFVYVSGRGDGHLHILNRHTGVLIKSVPIDSGMDGMTMGAMPGGIAVNKIPY